MMAPNAPNFSLVLVSLTLILSHQHVMADMPYFGYHDVVTFDTQNCNHKVYRPDGTLINQETSLRTAFSDANTLAHAGVIAAARPHDPPFNYYFHPEDNETVVENLQMVIALTEDPRSFGTHPIDQGRVALTCNEPRWCRLKNQWGYAQVWSARTQHKTWE